MEVTIVIYVQEDVSHRLCQDKDLALQCDCYILLGFVVSHRKKKPYNQTNTLRSHLNVTN